MAKSSVAEWFAGKSGAELDVVEFEGRQLYAESLKVQDAKTGKVIETPVRVRTPSAADQLGARDDCLRLIQKFRKLDKVPDVPRAVAEVGASYFEHLDTVCLVARCARWPEPPHAPRYLPEILDEKFPRAAIYELFERIDYYTNAEDVRVKELSEDDFWAAVANIAKVRNLSPLVAIDGSARDSFVISMAERLQNSRTQQSSSRSIETSTPAA